MFWTGIETTKTNRIFSKQTEKISKKLSLLGGPRNRYFFFLVRTQTNRNKPKLNLFRLFFGLLFRETKIFFFRFVSVCFDVSDRYRNNQNKQNLWYGELKRLIFLQICCCFGLSFVYFGCFETLKLPVSILKRNNRNKPLVSDSA